MLYVRLFIRNHLTRPDPKKLIQNTEGIKINFAYDGLSVQNFLMIVFCVVFVSCIQRIFEVRNSSVGVGKLLDGVSGFADFGA